MVRRSFLGALAASAATASPLYAAARSLVGERTTQHELFAALPVPSRGQWMRITMGSGVQYSKQVGLGIERTVHGGERRYVETQIGPPGGIACNPNTLKKTYVRGDGFGGLMTTYPVLAIVARSGNTLTRWADADDGQTQTPADAHMRLLDAAYLYGAAPLVIRSLAPASVRVGDREHETTHVVADVVPAGRLRRVELWHTPAVPFGVVRYRATVDDLDPFELGLSHYGDGFKTELTQTLETLRAMTPDGMDVQN